MATKIHWKRLESSGGVNPKPRHGHRAVAIKDLIIIFGGGNEGIVEDLNVYNCATNQWFQPAGKGEIPTGCAAFGFASDGSKIVMFGGMVEYGKYSADLWELNPASWQWRKIKPRPPRTAALPCARLGHSLTYAEGKYYLFAGLANDSKDPKQNLPRYLNDLYVLECKGNNYGWEQPTIRGTPPAERESHSCVFYRGQIENRPKLIIYGGMNGHRLGDLWSFHLDFSQWTQITASGLAPQPRSLHSSVIIGHRMFVFGGWIPLIPTDTKEPLLHEKEWKCTNTLASFNLETNSWELLGHECSDDNVPRARAGHCSIAVNTRMYIWSGRDGYRKAWNNQVCCKDLWCLETAPPSEPDKVQLVKAGISNLEVTWTPVSNADSYILQIQRVDAPPEQPPSTSSNNSSQNSLQTPSLPLQSISASLFATKSPHSVLTSLIPTFNNEQQMSSALVSSKSDSTDPSSTSLNKSASDLLSLAHLSAAQTPISSTISTINAQTLSTVSQVTNSTTNPSFIFQKATPVPTTSSMQHNHGNQTIRPIASSNIQFLNATASNPNSATVRPIIFHQKATTSNQPQLLTVMPAGVRLQQLTPVVRPSTNQSATFVRLMTPMTSTIRPGGTGQQQQQQQQQQIIQLNTNKQQQQQQPLVIKAITASGANRGQQQSIVLTTNSQQKMILSQNQPQQVLLLNQNTFNNNNNTSSPASQTKVTLQMTNIEQIAPSNEDQSQQETTPSNNLPQLDGSYSMLNTDTVNNHDSVTYESTLYRLQQNHGAHPCFSFLIPQLDGSVDDQALQNGTNDAQNTANEILTTSMPLGVVQSSTNTDSQLNMTNHDDKIPTVKSEFQSEIQSTDTKPSVTEDNDGWHIVGTFRETSTDIKHYYMVPSKVDIDHLDLLSLQGHKLAKKVDLEPGVIYKLRIAAVNSCGRSPWSEAAAFKTCLPGSPPAPSNIKITKTPDGGAHLTWDPPTNASSLITGYAVYLAVKNTAVDNNVRQQPQQASQMTFVRVYGGALPECSVNAPQLLQAHLDISSSSKPAIIFRIAARNERGYGPATQVRWLQDQQQIASNAANAHSVANTNGSKRTGSNTGSNASNAKKPRTATPDGASNEG